MKMRDALADLLMKQGQMPPSSPNAQMVAQAIAARQMPPSPGMLPPDNVMPPDTFGGYDDGLRPIPHTADVPPVPSRGEQRAMQMPADPALMDAEMMKMEKGPVAPGRVNKQSEIRPLSPDEGRAVGAPSTGSGEVIIQDEDSPVGMRTAIIPGSAAERELQEQEQRAQLRQQLRSVYSDTFFGNLDDARALAAGEAERGGLIYNLVGGDATTGAAGNFLDNFAGTAAYDLDQLIVPLRANVAFDRLQAMRDSSPTGAALGAISDTELGLLEGAITSLDSAQSNDQFLRALDRLEDAYNRIYFGEPPDNVSMTQWREFHRQNRNSARSGGDGIQTDIQQAIAPTGGQRPTHRFNPQTGQIEAIQ